MSILSNESLPITVFVQRILLSMRTSVPFSGMLRSAGASCLALALLFSFSLPALAQSEGDDPTQQLQQAYQQGMQAGQQGNHETAYASLEEAIDLAEQAEQSRARRQIADNLVRMAKNWGNNALEAERNEEALMHFEKGADYDPEDAYFFYGMGLAELRLENEEAAMEHMQEALRVGEATGNQRVVGLATERVRDEYIFRASQALSADNVTSGNIEQALEALDTLEEFVDPNDRSYFYRAVALFERGDYEDAIANARQGLDLHTGSRSDAARFHFVIAESLFQMGNTEEACAAFEDAAFGDYRARAEHYLENECS